MQRRKRLWIRWAASLMLLVGLTACGASTGGGDDGGGDDGGGTNSSPTASFTFACSDLACAFTDTSSDGDGTVDAWAWQFGDGATSTVQNPTHTYSAAGSYTVTLTVTDDDGATDTSSQTVTVGAGTGSGATQVGYMSVSETRSASSATGLAPAQTDEVSAQGSFLEVDPAIPGGYFDNPWAGIVDTCEVFDSLNDDPLAGLPLPGDLTIAFQDAGASVTIEEGASTYLTLPKTEFTNGGETSIFYESSTSATPPVPSGLTVSIPGADFPAVASAAFPNPAPFTLTAPADPSSVDTSTTFTWEGASNDPNTVVKIDLFSFDETSASFTYVFCYAADDGSFSLPSDTQAELGATFSGSVESAGREAIAVQDVGDAKLVLTVSRSESYGAFGFPTTGE